MRYLAIIFISIILVSCGKENNDYKQSIEELTESNKVLTEKVQSLNERIGKLEEESDYLLNSLINLERSLMMEKYSSNVQSETYWEREAVFESDDEDEFLFHVSASDIYPREVVLTFIGVQVIDQFTINVNVYKKEMNWSEHLIESFEAEYYSYDSEPVAADLIRRFNNNFQIRGDNLFYYTSPDGYNNKVYKQYDLRLNDEPKVISEEEYNSLPIKLAYDDTGLETWSAKKGKYNAVGHQYQIDIYEEGDLIMSLDNFLKTEDLLIGKFVWDDNATLLFFDNSGVDYRCIWTMNPKTQQVIKIIPEHHAIHPFYFKSRDNGGEYLLYVEENKIMRAYPPKS